MPVPLLSILVPAYNVAPYLKQCVDSILSQEMTDVELIVFDDGSTDGTTKQLKKLTRDYPSSIKVIFGEGNSGPSTARNTLFKHSVGKYLWFLDADDWLEKGAIKTVKNLLRESKPDLILFDYFIADTLRNRPRTSFSGQSNKLCNDLDALLFGLFFRKKFQVWCKVFKRELMGEGCLFIAGRLMEDIPFSIRLALRVKSHYYLNECLVYYRQRPGSILTSDNLQKRLPDTLLALDGVMEDIMQVHPKLSYKTHFAICEYAFSQVRQCIKNHKILGQNSPTSRDQIYATFYRQVGLTSATLTGLYVKNFAWAALLRFYFWSANTAIQARKGGEFRSAL